MYNTKTKQVEGGKLALALLCPVPQGVLCKLRMDLTLQGQESVLSGRILKFALIQK